METELRSWTPKYCLRAVIVEKDLRANLAALKQMALVVDQRRMIGCAWGRAARLRPRLQGHFSVYTGRNLQSSGMN